MDVAIQRLRNQRLVGKRFAAPEEVVGCFRSSEGFSQAILDFEDSA